MTKTYTPRRSAEQWQSLVDQWQSSGQSIKQFCTEQALSYASFCQWRKRLAQNDESTTASDQPNRRLSIWAPWDRLNLVGHIVLSLGGGIELTLSQS